MRNLIHNANVEIQLLQDANPAPPPLFGALPMDGRGSASQAAVVEPPFWTADTVTAMASLEATGDASIDPGSAIPQEVDVLDGDAQPTDPLEIAHWWLESLESRGSGEYTCPFQAACAKGGVRRDGRMIVFTRNSDFRYIHSTLALDPSSCRPDWF